MAKSYRSAFIRVSAINHTEKDGDVTYCKADIDKTLKDWADHSRLTYWFIEHPADEDVSNTHWHIVLKFGNPTSFDTIKSKFPYGDIESAKSIKACVQYLVHLNDLSKVQYDWDNIVTNCPDMTPYKVLSNSQGEVTIEHILGRIDKGEIREYNQFEMIDISIWSKYKTRIENALTHYRERIFMDKNRNIDVIFMSGATGVGKTTFAKNYCEKAGLSYCISSSSNDPMQDYKGQDVLILDDLRDDSFKFSDMLKLLDNHTKSTVSSRYHNKGFIGSLIIITSAKPLNDWYFDVLKEDKDQLYRRIKTQYQFDDKTIKVFQFNDNLHRYEFMGSAPNVIIMTPREQLNIARNMFKSMGIEFSEAINNKLDKVSNMSDDEFKDLSLDDQMTLDSFLKGGGNS